MLLTGREKRLCKILRDLPQEHGYRYEREASQSLHRALFTFLAAENGDYLRTLFRGKVPKVGEDWCLRKAQGMMEGSEYSEAARGKACGHIFKNGDATYRCKTCTSDDTCVLCTRCFEASDHTGHVITHNISIGNSGCCDCGDEEAWRIPVKCAIHTADGSIATGKQSKPLKFPDELLESVKMTIGRAMDFLCDVVSCSPENLRIEKRENDIREDERLSYLSSRWYEESPDPDPEFALLLWNDEKHTVNEVKEQVARACKKKVAFGLAKANETNDNGRSVVEYSKDISHLLKIAKVIEQIKITVTIRSSRDTFREQMCDTIIEWLEDIAGCSLGSDHKILQQTICEELLKAWRTGSMAFNKGVGKKGLDDHEVDESARQSTTVWSLAHRRGALTRQAIGLLSDDSDSDDAARDNGNENDDGDDEAESQIRDRSADVERMQLDVNVADSMTESQDMDRDMRTPGELEDDMETSEATYAGYPPPPPPPPAPFQQMRGRSPMRTFSTDSDIGDHFPTNSLASRPIYEIPETPWLARKRAKVDVPSYWLERPESYPSNEHLPLHENLRQRVRLDWMMLFDLRLWKKARIGLRDLYISTVVSVPQFKRILGLRFAGIYTLLAQLYLVADREPDNSIVHLSVQTLTSSSILEENIERANFLTNMIAILYTFLTHRQVGHPEDVNVTQSLAFDAGSVANRRMYFFFSDLRRLFDNPYVQKQLRTQERYQLQFLDLIRLPQGICPNVRAVGDHVEYENDVWIGASLMTKDINRLCRQFAESFRYSDDQDNMDLRRAIRTVTKATIVNSIGAERVRFEQSEIKKEVQFDIKSVFSFERHSYEVGHSVVEFVVENEPISFHHALHYTLSWLIDIGKAMTVETLRGLLSFTVQDLRQSFPLALPKIPDFDPESYLMALFDFPLRVCAWLAQMKASMWVRNGLSLRHQMGTYRGVSYRDFGYHRDIFLLQTAMVVCDPSRVLASMIDRFGMDDWMRGNYDTREGYERSQQLDVAEDFIHLLIVLLSDRTTLQPNEKESDAQALALRRDIVHILCFKPLSFSDLNSRLGLGEKSTDLEDFKEILEEMTTYRAPEGLSDSGLFELKPEYLADVDPYIAHYTKNQRDEAEQAYRLWIAKRTGKPAADIVLEPRLRPIHSGIFANLSSFTKTPLFAQIIFYSLSQRLHTRISLDTPITRMEAYLQVVLHLMLVAVLEDDTNQKSEMETHHSSPSFVLHVLQKESILGITIFDVLVKMLENCEIKGCHPRIRLILHRIQQRQPHVYNSKISLLYSRGPIVASLGLDRLGFESSQSPLGETSEAKERKARELKKQQALDRHAKVMAQFQQQQQNFLDNQDTSAWTEEDSDGMDSVATGGTEEHKKTWKYPSGNCILCQEETDDTRLFGTFGLMTNSNMFRQTPIQDVDFLGEVLSTPISLDRKLDGTRPFGVSGQNRNNVVKRAFDGSEVLSEYQGLGKGFPPSHTSRGPVSVGCGHIMHFSCFDLYCNSTLRRQNHQIARNHPERLKLKEFVCPLCKALGNTFLPIVWRGKEELYPGVLHTESSFENWLSSGIGLTVSRFYKREEGRSGSTVHQDRFVTYTSRVVMPPIASKLTSLFQKSLSSPTSPQGSSRNSMPGRFPPEEGYSMISPTHQLSTEVLLIDELISVYLRIGEAIRANGLPSQFPSVSQLPGSSMADFSNSDTLAKTLGNSIAATEVAQRGIQSQPGQILLDKIPTSVMTHLRILSETASSYIAIGGLRNSGSNTPANEFSAATQNQLLQLFGNHPQIYGDEVENALKHQLPSALSQDPFVFLTECSIYLVPAFNLDILHIVHLCYLLEIVKVTLYLTAFPEVFEAWRKTRGTVASHSISSIDTTALLAFLKQIRRFSNPPWPMTAAESAALAGYGPTEFLVPLYKAISSYALTFLRKAAILLNIRYGVDFPDTGFADIDKPELERLTRALNLLPLSALFAFVGNPTSDEHTVQEAIVAGWIQHWQYREDYDVCMRSALPLSGSYQDHLGQSTYKSLRPQHPAIFELIGLPKQFDTLIYEVTKRRCPTTGNRMEDAVLCLFCGDMFCSQASCCMKNNKGGCHQHMQKCGIDTGLFLNIRKCFVLYSHHQNGSWSPAPYLDKYGEPDAGLRRGRQLFLNQKRYDALYRNVWLQQGIPTTIARKLETDINNGGWETL